MLKAVVIIIALLIAVVNVSAQTSGHKSVKRVHQASAIRIGPPTTYLKEGLTSEEVVRILGNPLTVSERDELGIVIETYEFKRGAKRVLIAEFVRGSLVSSRTENRESMVQSAGG